MLNKEDKETNLELVKIFIDNLGLKNELQKKYVEKWKPNEQELNELNNVLEFFTEVYDNKCDIDYIVDAYLF